MDPADLSEPGTDQEGDEDQEILFAPRVERVEEPPPAPKTVQATTDCEIITMVKTLNGAIATVSQDTARIRRAYDQLRAENITQDKALADLSAMVREYGSPPATMWPHPVIQSDVLDEDGNLRAANIGITWAGNDTFFHGVRVVRPGPPRPAGMGPVISTPYHLARDHDRENASMTAQPPTPLTPLTVPDAEIQRTSMGGARTRGRYNWTRPPWMWPKNWETTSCSTMMSWSNSFKSVGVPISISRPVSSSPRGCWRF